MTRRQRSILRAAVGVFLLLLVCHWLLWLKYNRCSLRWWGWGYAFLDYFLLDQSRPMLWYTERGFRNVRLGMTREEALSLAGPPVTEYNLEGYSDTAFRKLHFGMAQEEVERILGKPIAVRRIDENISVEFHGGDLWPPDNNHARETRKTLVWEYSLPRFADRDSVLYRRRSVIFDFPNGHDARIHGIRTGVSPWETVPERRPMEDGDTPCSFLFNGFWL